MSQDLLPAREGPRVSVSFQSESQGLSILRTEKLLARAGFDFVLLKIQLYSCSMIYQLWIQARLET